MKKIISVLLALIMMFSVTTVAFATDAEETTTPSTEESVPSEGGEGEATPEPEEGEEDSLLGEYDWILDLPFATVKPALKIAKIALKLYMVYLKLGFIFGWVDKEAFAQQVSDFISGLIGNAQPEDTAPEEPSTIPAAA